MEVVKKSIVFLQTLALYMVAFAIPTSIRAFSAVCVGVLLGTGVLQVVINKQKVLWSRIKDYWPILLLFILCLIAVAWTNDLSLVKSKLEAKSNFILLPLGFLLLPSITEKQKRTCFLYFLAGLGMASVIGLLGALFLRYKNWGDYFYYKSFAELLGVHTTYFGMMLLVGLMLTFTPSMLSKKVRIAAIILIYLLIYLISSRMILFLSVVLPVFQFVISRWVNSVRGLNIKYFIRFSLVLFIVAVVVVVALQYLPHFALRWQTAENIQQDYSQYGEFGAKYSMWKAVVLTYLNNNLWFGSAYNYYSELYDNYLRVGYLGGYLNKFNAHNQYLEFLLSNGLLGFVSLLLVFYHFLVRALHKTQLINLSFLLVIALVCCTESIFERYHGVLLFSYFACLLIPTEITAVHKILLLGPVYPPAGGVSIHLMRLKKLLLDEKYEVDLVDESRTIKDDVFNIRSLNIVQYVKKILDNNIIHVHSGKTSLRLFHCFTAKILLKDVVCTIHSKTNLKNRFTIFTNKHLLPLFTNEIIVVNEELARLLNCKKVRVISPFIPPLPEEFEILPKSVVSFLNKNKSKKIIVSNASKITFFEGVELYGLEKTISLFKVLNERFPSTFAVVFVLCDSEQNQSYLKKCIDSIDSGIENDFLLYQGQLSFSNLMSKADIVLRLTATDGDSLTIREALHLNKKVVASDVVKRPRGTITCDMNDVDNVVQAINETPILNKQVFNKDLFLSVYA